jgi:phage repressor protein C with HTH and peptisase S24 domain
MEFDDRPHPAMRLQKARERRGFKTAKDAAKFFGWNYETYAQHENGNRGIVRAASAYAKAFKVSEAWLLTGEGAETSATVPILGYVGAGAEVEPDFEQTPPEGLDEIEIPFPLPAEMAAFVVRGDSMLPVFKDGHVIVVYKDQKRPLESFYGEEAAVRTADGKRFIKTIMRGNGNTVNLISWNAQPIENARLEWIGEIFGVFPRSSLGKMGRQGGVQGQLRLRA